MTIDETHFYKPPLNSNRLSYEDGYKDATERIIKLLEEWPICDESCYCLPCNLGETEMIRTEFKNLLTLIKGEK